MHPSALAVKRKPDYSGDMFRDRPKPPGYEDHPGIEEVAALLNCSVRKVWYLVDAEALDVVRLKGPRTLVTPASLTAYVDRNDRSKK